MFSPHFRKNTLKINPLVRAYRCRKKNRILINVSERGCPVWRWHLDCPCPLLSPLDQRLLDTNEVSQLLLGAVSAFLGQDPARRPEQYIALHSSALFLWFRLWRTPRQCAGGTCSSHDCIGGKFSRDIRPTREAQPPKWVLSGRASSLSRVLHADGSREGPQWSHSCYCGCVREWKSKPNHFLGILL